MGDPYGVCEYTFNLIYPVMVCSGDMFECRLSGEGYDFVPSDHIQLDWSVHSSKFNQDFRIHVLRESALPKFLERLRKDHKRLRLNLDENKDRIYRSVKPNNLAK